MSGLQDPVHLFDLFRLIMDPLLPVKSTAEIQRIQDLASRFSLELQAMGDDAALSFVVFECRRVDADFDSLRKELCRRLNALDLIQEIRREESFESAMLMVAMKLQLDQIALGQREIANALREESERSQKQIVADGYYSYLEAKRAVGVSESTLRRQVKTGRLRTTKVGGRVMFVGSDLLVYQRERQADLKVLGDASG